MPWIAKRPEVDGYLTRAGHYDASKRNAWRFKSREDAERVAPGHVIEADTVRRGVDQPCAIHKGPAGDCQPWNCTCY